MIGSEIGRTITTYCSLNHITFVEVVVDTTEIRCQRLVGESTCSTCHALFIAICNGRIDISLVGIGFQQVVIVTIQFTQGVFLGRLTQQNGQVVLVVECFGIGKCIFNLPGKTTVHV